jgi:DNA modification methylase
MYQVIEGDCREVMRGLAAESVDCCVTSPPYFGLRDYGVAGQVGQEQSPAEFVAALVDVFRDVRRVLRDSGSLWLNLGDSYAMTTWGAGGAGKQHTNNGSVLPDRISSIPDGLKAKDLIGIPWRVAFALQSDGWYLRSDIIWHKPNVMPESVKDRPTKAHEYIFLLTKSPRYYYDADAVREPLQTPEHMRGKAGWGKSKKDHHETSQSAIREGQGRMGENPLGRNRRSVWTVTTSPYRGAHFATYPPALIEPCILAGCPEGGTVLDPFTGSGTTGVVSVQQGRHFIGAELNPAYAAMARERIASETAQGRLAA